MYVCVCVLNLLISIACLNVITQFKMNVSYGEERQRFRIGRCLISTEPNEENNERNRENNSNNAFDLLC